MGNYRVGTASTGLASELMLSALCLTRGLTVLTPLGEFMPYDLIVSNGTEHFKVQVKAANKHISIAKQGPTYERYTFQTSHGKKARKKYSSKEVDVFALHFIDTNEWAFIPVAEVSSTTIFFRRNVKHGDGVSIKSVNKYEKYKNNWKIFKAMEG